MGVRIGSAHFMYNYQVALNNAYQEQNKLFEQSDGSSLHRGSDNPMNYTKLMRYTVSDNENEQYRENIKTATSWMHDSDSVMIHMSEIMQTLKEKSVDAANSTNVDDDYDAIYREMYACMQELVSVSNTQINDRYLFAGQMDLTPPFTMSLEMYDRGQVKSLDTDQAAFFKGTDSDYNTDLLQMLTVKDEAGNTFYVETDGGKLTRSIKTEDDQSQPAVKFNLYTQKFIDDGYKELIAMGYRTIEDAELAATSNERVAAVLNAGRVGKANEFKVANYFNNQGLLKDPANNSITVNGAKYTFQTFKQNIVTYKGDENLISMVKLNGATDPNADTVNTTGGRMFGRDIFDNETSGNEASGTAMLNELFGMCERVHQRHTNWMSSDGVTIADVAHATLVVEETRVGARQQLYTSVETMLNTQADNITEDITNVSGADIAKLATKLMEMTTLYNLSLSIGGRILPQSLADYL